MGEPYELNYSTEFAENLFLLVPGVFREWFEWYTKSVMPEEDYTQYLCIGLTESNKCRYNTIVNGRNNSGTPERGLTHYICTGMRYIVDKM